MKVFMAFFEARKAVAAASVLTLLVLAASFHSALSQENVATDSARPAAQAAAPVSPAAVPSATTAPAANAQPPASAAPAMSSPSSQAGNSGESSPAANGASAQQAASGAGELPQNLSAWGMFLHADRIVKTVMIGLALASLLTWAMWLAKSLELRRASSEVHRDLRVLANCSTLAEAHERLLKGRSSVAQLMQGAANEIRASIKLRADGLKERISLAA
jgi:biopolymer transport protein ExbB